MDAKFRFMDLEIWKDSIEIAQMLFDIADDLQEKRFYRFAEQLRGSGLSMSNNIAEGSGSQSSRDFSNFLNIARRSTYENANVLLVLKDRGLVDEEVVTEALNRLDHLCRKITNFQRSLGRHSAERKAHSAETDRAMTAAGGPSVKNDR